MSGQRAVSTLLLSVAALLAGFGVFYHFVITTPRRERAMLELERQRIAESEARASERPQRWVREMEFARGLLLHTCLHEATVVHQDEWSKTCIEHSLPADCSLAPPLADRLDGEAKQRRLACFAKYPPPV